MLKVEDNSKAARLSVLISSGVFFPLGYFVAKWFGFFKVLNGGVIIMPLLVAFAVVLISAFNGGGVDTEILLKIIPMFNFLFIIIFFSISGDLLQSRIKYWVRGIVFGGAAVLLLYSYAGPIPILIKMAVSLLVALGVFLELSKKARTCHAAV